MLILLPPSETKRDGGVDGTTLDLRALTRPGLLPQRTVVLASLRALSRNLTTMASALRLGPQQHFELLRNRSICDSPTMPALERYTGVLFDALDAVSLSPAARQFAAGRLGIHSALFGLLDSEDQIPAYRLSHNSSLPGLSLKKTWASAVSSQLVAYDGLILDLRSEAYVALGPVPPGGNSTILRLVADDGEGRRRALTHFNKKGKGFFVRQLLEAGIDHASTESLLDWATGAGLELGRGRGGELELVI